MTVIITTYDDRTFEVSNETAETVSMAMAEGGHYVKLGELGVTLAVNDIRRMDNAAPSHEGFQPMLPRPKRTPWKLEQFQMLEEQHKKLGYWPAWIETEAEFRAVLAGEKSWPELKSKGSEPKQTVVLDGENNLVEVKETGGYYSEEAIAERRAENRKKYAPQHEVPKIRKRIKPEVNNVTELPF